MDKRKELILDIITKEHIKTANPIGSGFLAKKCKLNLSPATIRNEMAELEDMGYIAQPYVSAGRIPTEKAYRLYVEKIQKEKAIYKLDNLKEFLRDINEKNLKNCAKYIAEFSGNTVFWAFNRNDLYYTGVSNLLKQPEFARVKLIYDISIIIDRMDEVVDKMFENFQIGVKVLIGSDNVFGDLFGTTLAKYKFKNNHALFGILGPMRMNYKKNIAITNFIYNYFK